MNAERRYDRSQTALVLQRVAELQAAELGHESLSRAELARVVDEAGLDARHLDRALAELDTRDKREARLLGLRQFVLVHRQAEGELDRADLDAAAALLDREVGVLGERQLGDDPPTLTWFGRHVAVSITGRRGTIEIQIEERFVRTARARLGTALSSAAPSLALTTVVAGPLAWGLVAVPVLAYVGARAFHAGQVATTEARLERLADRLVDRLSSPDS